ncbi:MAG: sulfatase [Cellulophaga sp.]
MNRLYLFIFLVVCITTTSTSQKKTNIVYINIDDLGWTDLSCFGSTFYETPNIDRLASQGMKFTDAYASAANCAPSRAGFLSGQYSPRHGIYTVNSSERGNSKHRKLIPTPNTITLHDSIVTIAEALKKKNYTTASMGKWHVGEDPKTQGFDINIGGTHVGHPKSYFSPYHNKKIKDGLKGEYLTDRLTDEAISFLNKNKDNPFFLYMTYYTVHTPLQGKKALVNKYKNKPASPYHKSATYAAMVESMDTNVGRLISALELLQLTNNTIIVFTSDNGGLQNVSKQYPLKYGKGSYYEGGTRVPLIIRWDGKVKPKTVSNFPVNNIDFYPSFLDIVNLAITENQILDGQSLLPLLLNKGKLKKRPLFWHFPIYLQTVKNYDEPNGRDSYFRTRPGSTMRYGKWKLHQYFEDGAVELYNLKSDLSEKNNLALKLSKKTAKLLRILNSWRTATNAPIPSQLNPEYQ